MEMTPMGTKNKRSISSSREMAMDEIEANCKNYKLNDSLFKDYKDLRNALDTVSANIEPRSSLNNVNIIDLLNEKSNYLMQVGDELVNLEKEKEFVNVNKLKWDENIIKCFMEYNYIEPILNRLDEIKIDILGIGGVIEYSRKMENLPDTLHELQNANFHSDYYLKEANELIEIIKTCISIKGEIAKMYEYENKLIGYGK
jgi:hypothetical protein